MLTTTASMKSWSWIASPNIHLHTSRINLLLFIVFWSIARFMCIHSLPVHWCFIVQGCVEYQGRTEIGRWIKMMCVGGKWCWLIARFMYIHSCRFIGVLLFKVVSKLWNCIFSHTTFEWRIISRYDWVRFKYIRIVKN